MRGAAHVEALQPAELVLQKPIVGLHNAIRVLASGRARAASAPRSPATGPRYASHGCYMMIRHSDSGRSKPNRVYKKGVRRHVLARPFATPARDTLNGPGAMPVRRSSSRSCRVPARGHEHNRTTH